MKRIEKIEIIRPPFFPWTRDVWGLGGGCGEGKMKRKRSSRARCGRKRKPRRQRPVGSVRLAQRGIVKVESGDSMIGEKPQK